MTKILESANINFGAVEEFTENTVSSKIYNIGTERVSLDNLVSDNAKFQASVSAKAIEPKFPASSDIYFLNAKGKFQGDNGEYSTVSLGYGKAGTTDADGKLAYAYSPDMPSLSLTGPSAETKYKLSESFNITWNSSNIEKVKITLESESGGSKVYNDITASLGTYSVSIEASDGFSVNELVYIYIDSTLGCCEDSVQVQSIATVTINTPSLTAGVEGNVTGTSNGAEVDVYYRTTSPQGSWEVFEEGVTVDESGNWTATGTIADAGTYDFRARDTVDPDGQIQIDDVVVELESTTTLLSMTATCTADTPTDI